MRTTDFKWKSPTSSPWLYDKMLLGLACLSVQYTYSEVSRSRINLPFTFLLCFLLRVCTVPRKTICPWGGIRAKPECSSALNVASDEVPRDQVLVFNTVPVWFQGSCHKACPSSHDLRRKPIPCRETCVSKELKD